MKALLVHSWHLPRDLMSKSHIQHHSATVTWNCWKYFGNLKRVTNTRDYQPTIHSGTRMLDLEMRSLGQGVFHSCSWVYGGLDTRLYRRDAASSPPKTSMAESRHHVLQHQPRLSLTRLVLP